MHTKTKTTQVMQNTVLCRSSFRRRFGNISHRLLMDLLSLQPAFRMVSVEQPRLSTSVAREVILRRSTAGCTVDVAADSQENVQTEKVTVAAGLVIIHSAAPVCIGVKGLIRHDLTTASITIQDFVEISILKQK